MSVTITWAGRNLPGFEQQLPVEADHAVEHVECGVLEALARRGSPNPQAVEGFAHAAIDLSGDHAGRLVNMVTEVIVRSPIGHAG